MMVAHMDHESSMSMPMSASSTMSGMSMSSPTHTTMHMPSIKMMGMQAMAMTFFTSSDTPLYSMAWMPGTTGQYAGTCIFLIACAALFRAMLAVRCQFYPLLRAVDARRNAGLDQIIYRKEKAIQYQWRARDAILIGVLDMVLAGVGYLL